MSKIAQEVTVIVSIAFPIILVAVGALLLGGGIIVSDAEGLSIVGIILVVIGVLLEAFVIWKFTLIKRSGHFVEFSAQLVLDEKAVLGMPMLLGLFSIVTGFFMFFGFLQINTLLMLGDSTEPNILGVLLGAVFIYIYLIVYLGVYYSLSAGVISYASDWYRGLDPDLGSAMKDVRQVFPVILKFAFLMATVKLVISALTSAGRNRGASGGSGAAIGLAISAFFISIIGAVWQFLNYFTLISIVQNKKGVKDSIKDSASTTWNSLLDVLVGDTGFSLVMFIFAIINTGLWIIAGFGVGIILFPSGLAGSSALVMGVLFAFVFVVLGFLPYNIVTMPMKVAFTTFIYSYAKDSMEGFSKPSRLPEELRDEFKTLSNRDRKRRMRDPTEYF